MDWKKEWKPLLWIVAAFLTLFYLPVGTLRFDLAITEALHLAKWYAREHVILCLIPAFFIAGAIGVFVKKESVMKYLGPKANKALAYGVASVSGTILAVCSCTVLPLFSGIWRMGAGLGPASAFLYSGPAINVLAIILTARVLGLELGIARAVGAVAFSVVIGLIMHLIYRKEELRKADAQAAAPVPAVSRPLWQNALFFAAMAGILIFANWGAPNQDAAATVPSFWTAIRQAKWAVTSGFAVGLGLILILWLGVTWWKVALATAVTASLAIAFPNSPMLPFIAGAIGLSIVAGTDKGEAGDWLSATWVFAKQILPLLLLGVLISGFLLGRPDHEGLVPSRYVRMLVGDSPQTFLDITGLAGGGLEQAIRAVWPVWTNFFASVFGAFMYFATLTEVPILQGLIGSGMGKGPALALLLAGPALSLPSMLVLRGIMGTGKTVVYVSLVVVMATISGLFYGAVFG